MVDGDDVKRTVLKERDDVKRTGAETAKAVWPATWGAHTVPGKSILIIILIMDHRGRILAF